MIYSCAGGVLFYSTYDKVQGSTMLHEWHFQQQAEVLIRGYFWQIANSHSVGMLVIL